MSRKKQPVTQRIAGPIDIGSSRFILGGGLGLEYVSAVHRLVFGEDSFFIVLYSALNAGGLIGCEHNGITICWENKGEVVLMGHGRDGSYMRASAAQRAEFDRICAMDVDEFRDFVNGHPQVKWKILLPSPAPITSTVMSFMTAAFTDTEPDRAEATAKATFLTELVAFLRHHCDRRRFTQRLYDGLYLHLGHIAHFNASGFYDEWFDDLESRIRFLEHHATGTTYGPWADVARMFKVWLDGPEGQAVLAFYKRTLAADVEAAERRRLAELKAKYESETAEVKTRSEAAAKEA